MSTITVLVTKAMFVQFELVVEGTTRLLLWTDPVNLQTTYLSTFIT